MLDQARRGQGAHGVDGERPFPGYHDPAIAAGPPWQLDTYREELEATAAAPSRRPGQVVGWLGPNESTGNDRASACGDWTGEQWRSTAALYRNTCWPPPLASGHDQVAFLGGSSTRTLFQQAAWPASPSGRLDPRLFKQQGPDAGIKAGSGRGDPAGGPAGGRKLVHRLRVCGSGAPASRLCPPAPAFAKWRVVLRQSQADGCPAELCVRENAWGLAR